MEAVLFEFKAIHDLLNAIDFTEYIISNTY